MNQFCVSSAPADEKNIYIKNDVRISVLSDKIVRIEKASKQGFIDLATQIVICRNFAKPQFTITESGYKVSIITRSAKFDIDTRTLKFTCESGSKHLEVSEKDNLKGTVRTLDMNGGNVKFPDGLMSKSGVTVLDDSKSCLLNLNGEIIQREKGTQDFYILAFGRNYLEGLKDYFGLTGYPPIIPKYALGNWWSRYHAYSDNEYIELMDKFRNKGIPLTVATVDMDWHIVKNVPKKVNNSNLFQGRGWTGYTFEKSLFPDYKSFLNQLKNRGLAITLNLHPRDGVRFFEQQYSDMAQANGIDPKSKKTVKFDLTNSKFRDSYFDILHHPYEKDGVDFWWIDWQQGKKSKIKGLDPLWLLNHYHTLDINRNKEDGIILSRYAGLGSHRYPLGFSGDTIVCWKSLQIQPYFTATASNVGYTWWSHDIGGHQFSKGDNELYLRWLQLGVFSPINRLHSTKIGISKEPWLYPKTEEFAKEIMILRHKLLPYLYTADIRTHQDAIPLCSPMYYFYDCENAYKDEFKNQYIFGEQLLVAPVVEPSTDGKLSKLKVWFPSGVWTNIFNGEKYEGDSVAEVVCPLNEYPVFARAGAIIPLLKTEYNSTKFEELDIKMYIGQNKYVLRDTDGEICFDMKKSKNGYVLELSVNGKLDTKRLNFELSDAKCADIIVDGVSCGKVKGFSMPLKASKILIKNIETADDKTEK